MLVKSLAFLAFFIAITFSVAVAKRTKTPKIIRNLYFSEKRLLTFAFIPNSLIILKNKKGIREKNILLG